MSAAATAESGQRSATRPLLPVTLRGKRCVASMTSVNAPGQNFVREGQKCVGNVASQHHGRLDRIHENRQGARFRPALHLKNPLDGGQRLKGSAESP